MWIIVGFKVGEERSVFYRKVMTKEELVKAVIKASEKSDFISIRIIQKRGG